MLETRDAITDFPLLFASTVPTTSTQVSASIEKSVKCEEKQKCTGAPAQQAASKALTNVLDYLKTVDRCVQDAVYACKNRSSPLEFAV